MKRMLSPVAGDDVACALGGGDVVAHFRRLLPIGGVFPAVVQRGYRHVAQPFGSQTERIYAFPEVWPLTSTLSLRLFR